MKQISEKSIILSVQTFEDILAISTFQNEINVYRLNNSYSAFDHLFQLAPHSSPVTAMAIAQSMLLAGSQSGSIKLWDITDMDAIKHRSTSFVKRDGRISHVKFHPYTDFFATAYEHYVSVFDARHKTSLQDFSLGEVITAIEFSPDGQWVALCSEIKTAIWDLPSGSFLWQRDFGSTCLIYDPLELTLWCGNSEGIFSVDLDNWTEGRDCRCKNIKSLHETSEGDVLAVNDDNIYSVQTQTFLNVPSITKDSLIKMVHRKMMVYKRMDSVLYYDLFQVSDTPSVQPEPVTQQIKTLSISDQIPLVKMPKQDLKIPWNDNFSSTDSLEVSVTKKLDGTQEFLDYAEQHLKSWQSLNVMFATQPNIDTLFSFLYAQKNPRLILDVFGIIDVTRYHSLSVFPVVTRCMEIVLPVDPIASCEVVITFLDAFKQLIIDSLYDLDVSHEDRRKKSESSLQAIKEFRFALDQLPLATAKMPQILQSRLSIENFLNTSKRDNL